MADGASKLPLIRFNELERKNSAFRRFGRELFPHTLRGVCAEVWAAGSRQRLLGGGLLAGSVPAAPPAVAPVQAPRCPASQTAAPARRLGERSVVFGGFPLYFPSEHSAP